MSLGYDKYVFRLFFLLVSLSIIFLLNPVNTKASSFNVPILMYHYIGNNPNPKDTMRNTLAVSPDKFEAQMAYLASNGYTAISLDTLYGIFNNQATVSGKPIVLTFDDGYLDFYTDVFPILKKYQVKAVAYIVPGFLEKPNNLTHLQLKEISKSGLVEIGAHTVFHTYLKKLDEKRVKFEVMESKQMLENELQIKVISFAYPYGVFDEKAIEIVKNAGFKTAVSTVPGIDASLENRFFLFRLRPSGRVGQSLLNFLENSTFNL